jgi:hypothetical protein
MKLIMALAASTFMVTSAFMQPAAAQRRSTGNTYSVMGSNETEINAQFNLFYEDEAGQLILDTAPDDLDDGLTTNKDKIGLFRGAVTNYILGYGSIRTIERSLEPSDYDSNGYPILTTPFEETVTAFPVGDLLAELITGADGKNYVRYSIFENYGTTLPYSNFILDPERIAQSFIPLPNPIKFDKAVNDLKYILNNNLLDGVSNFVSNTDLLVDDIDNIISDISNDQNGYFIIKQREIKPQRVPENNNAIPSLLFLIILNNVIFMKYHNRTNKKN